MIVIAVKLSIALILTILQWLLLHSIRVAVSELIKEHIGKSSDAIIYSAVIFAYLFPTIIYVALLIGLFVVL
jgi:hypothetical protein